MVRDSVERGRGGHSTVEVRYGTPSSLVSSTDLMVVKSNRFRPKESPMDDQIFALIYLGFGLGGF